MSPILTLQRRLRRLGKIRLGEVRETSRGTRPAALDKFRLTTAHREILDAAAERYGGTVGEWTDAPKGTGRQWELKTNADAMEVAILAGDVSLSQFLEMWSGGGCVRRCDGEIEQLSGLECMCPSSIAERRELATKGKACKETTRLSVLLPELPDVGTWMLESHGYYAAVELGGIVDLLTQVAAGRVVPGRLVIEHRTGMREGKRHEWIVPVLSLPSLTPNALSPGEPIPVQALSAPTTPGTGNQARRPEPPPLPRARRPDDEVEGRVAPEPAVPGAAPSTADRWVEGFARNVSKFADVSLGEDDARHALVAHVTDGRTSSSKELTTDERRTADKAILSLKRGRITMHKDLNGKLIVRETDG